MRLNFVSLNSLFGLLIFSGFIALQGCASKETTYTVKEKPVSESVYASGVIKAAQQYEVYAGVNGIIKKILVEEGDTVSAGTPLIIIDNTVSEFAADNARIAMEMSKDQTGPASNTLLDLEARLKLARERMLNDSILLKRQQNLWDQQVGAKLDLEKRELAFKSSNTDYYSVLLQYNQLKSDLEKKYRQSVNTFEISKKQQSDFSAVSNINGIVYDLLKEPGEFITTQTPIAIVGSADIFEIELQVDEFDIVKIKKGQRVFLTMDSYHEKIFEGIVQRIGPIMNPRSRTFTVFADFVDIPEVLYPNLTVEANVLIQKKDKALVIPAAYVTGGKGVLTAPDETTQVVTGISNMEWVEIIEGIKKEQVIYLPQ